MHKGLITQMGMAEKYDVFVVTISKLNVPPVIKKQKKKAGLYRERDLAKALLELYRKRYENYMSKAKIWKDKALEVKRIYEGGETGGAGKDESDQYEEGT